MQIYYDKRAGEYDASMGYDNSETVGILKPVISAVKALAEGKDVLELACGPGFWTSHICQSAGFVVATDFNQSTLDQALKKNLPTHKVRFQQANAYDLSAIAGEFDMLIAVDWLAHVPLTKMSVFLQGIQQRFANGSEVIFLDQLPGAHSLTDIFDDEGNHIQQRVLQNGETFKVIKHYFTDQQYENLLGPYFSDLSIRRFDECRRVLVSAITI